MIGKPQHNTANPTVHTSPWDSSHDPTAEIFSASPTHYLAVLTALSRYLPSKEPLTDVTESDGVVTDSDEFRMYEFKVRMCTRAKAHDWTECPFAHPGEKARRRDPRRYSYSGTACTDFRKGGCRRGDACEFAHGVFECWLHPTRYRTQACKDGSGCTRRVCFFAHAPGQLRVVSGQPSPVSVGSGSPDPFEDSPPLTPANRAFGPGSGTVGDVAAALRGLQLSKMKSMSMPTRSAWKGQAGLGLGSGLGSPRFGPSVEKAVRTGFYSLPTTPTRIVPRAGWEEEAAVERPAECSGRELRLRMWEKLSGENRVDLTEPVDSNPGGPGPDIGWVSELVK